MTEQSSRALKAIDQQEFDQSYREVPFNEEAEQLVLGAVLTDNEAMNRIADFLRAEHFYLGVHQRIFEAINRLNDRGLVASPVTLKGQFDADEGLSELGGASYLVKIAGMASHILNVKDHASIIYSLAISRELIGIGTEMVNDAFDSHGELRASEQIEHSEQKLFSLASQGNSDTAFAHFKNAIDNAIITAEAATKRDGAIHGAPTKFADMDALLGGLHNSDLIILAGRPSMGKTALAVNLALNIAEHLQQEFDEHGNADDKPKSVGFISLEMSSEQLCTRLLAMKTGIDAGNIRRGKLTHGKANDDLSKLVRASGELHRLPVFIDDTPAQSIAAVRTRARRLKRKHNLAFLVVDYLQLLRGATKAAESSRVQEVSEITMGLKAIAKELDIPIMALSQLSRAVEQRPDKRPQLSDLRESGSIEQDADMVMFIYREAYYIERDKPPEGSEKMAEWVERMEKVDNISEVIVAKNRNGPIGNVALFFNKATTRFQDFDSRNSDYEVGSEAF